jgi:hypothetical protein
MSPRKKKVQDGDRGSGLEQGLESGDDGVRVREETRPEETVDVQNPILDLPVVNDPPRRRTRRSPPKHLSVRVNSAHQFLEDPELVSLEDYDRYFLLLLYFLGRKAPIPNNPKWIAWRLSLGVGDDQVGSLLKKLFKAGLLEAADGPLAPAEPIRRQARIRSKRPRALRSRQKPPAEAAPAENEHGSADGGEPELSPAELLRRHRESWGSNLG